MNSETCPECGAVTPPGQLTHAYVPSSPGCWEAFGEVQADELTRFQYPRAHRIVVDAYMAQHVGASDDRRQRQSVFVHLLSLCFTLEHRGEDERGRELMRTSLERDKQRGTRPEFPKLLRVAKPGELNILSMRDARDLDDYTQRAMAWAGAVWSSFSEHHALIRERVSALTRR
jgi:hypothetical protein